MYRAAGKAGCGMRGMMGWLGEILKSAGGRCMSMGGFLLDDEGCLAEEYADDDEDWPEEIYSGVESQDGEDMGWSDCIWCDSECGRA